MKWLQRKFKQGHGMEAVKKVEPPRERAIRIWTDAKATDEGAWIGGWLEVSSDMKECPWYSLEVTEKIAPWLRCRGTPKRVIAALELLGTLVAVKLWVTKGAEVKVMVEAFTDNRGNDFAAKKGMSTKFPLTLLIMELSEVMRERKVQVGLKWVKRDDNQGADDLTNQEFGKFAEKLRRQVSEEDLRWSVMDGLLKDSEDLYKEIKEKQEERKARKQTLKKASTKKGKVFERWAS